MLLTYIDVEKNVIMFAYDQAVMKRCTLRRYDVNEGCVGSDNMFSLASNHRRATMSAYLKESCQVDSVLDGTLEYSKSTTASRCPG